jgi:tetratricopeptide (TPR) repeat protein
MRRMRFAALATLVFALSAAAQAPPPPVNCLNEPRNLAYNDFYNAKKATDAAGQQRAYELAKAFVENWTLCSDQYTDAAKRFVALYEDATERFALSQSAFGAKPDHAKAFEIGRKILTTNPDDLPALMALAYAGNSEATAKNEEFAAEALTDAKKAIALIESGKGPVAWSPFKSREDALSFLTLYAANLSLVAKDPAGAIPLYIKVGTIAGPAGHDPSSYIRLAAAYLQSQLEPMQLEYNEKFGGKPESAEGKWQIAQMDQVIDRVLDAYARAISLAGDNARYAQAKPAWMDALRNYYKFRFGDGMPGFDNYLANATTRPLPEPYVPKPYTPEPAAPKRR